MCFLIEYNLRELSVPSISFIKSSHAVIFIHRIDQLVLLHPVLEVRVPTVRLSSFGFGKGFVQSRHVARWGWQMSKVIFDLRQLRQRVGSGIVDLDFKEIWPVVERPCVAHAIVRGNANLTLRTKDSPLYGWDLGLLGTISRLGIAIEGCGTMQLVGEDGPGREDCVEDDLVRDVIGSCLVNYFPSEWIKDGYCLIVLDKQRFMLFDVAESLVMRHVSAIRNDITSADTNLAERTPSSAQILS